MIEFDQSVRAWYVRFRKGKVVKTVSDEMPGTIYVIDLDERNQVIGIELLGVQEFSINAVRSISRIDTSKVDFEKARFMPASPKNTQPA